MPCEDNDSQNARPAVKWIVSLVILVHFLAILTAVTGLGVGYAPPPALCAEANQKFAPYLELVFLQNPYRFYAPNPGCDPTMWARLRYSDGTIRWLELPSLSRFAAPVLKQRLMAMPRAAVETIAIGENGEETMLSPMSQVCLASYVRHIVRSCPGSDADGLPALTEDVEIYRIDQRCMMPFEARENWPFSDLRLRQATYLGTYFVNGTEREGPNGEPVPMPALAARVIRESVNDAVEGEAGAEGTRLTAARLPNPIRALLERYPDLLDADPTELAERVQIAIEGVRPTRDGIEPDQLAAGVATSTQHGLP